MAAFGAVLALVIGVPTLASANGVDNVLNGLGMSGGGSGGTGDTSAPTPEAGVPPDYIPPLHGTNPHGEGTDATVDLTPSETNPIEPNSEEITVGSSRGEQNADGTYHGRITLLNILGLEPLVVETNPGETKEGPLDPLQTQLLDQLCSATGNALCLTVLRMHSSTTSTGSENNFELLGLHTGDVGVNADVATSNGNISHDPATGCQTAHGDSQVVNALIGSEAAGISADTLEGSSTSTACPDGSQSVQQSSRVLGLGGVLAGLDIPITSADCENGVPNTEPSLLGLEPVLAAIGLASLVCNASDENAGQTSSPYGVREGLTAFLLPVAGLLKITTAGPESHAVAQAAQTNPPGPTGPGNTGNQGNKGNKGGNGGNNGGNGAGNGAGAGAAAGNAAAGNGQLAFTGADLLALGLVGGALILGGLALTTTAGRRHRRTV